MSTNYQWLWWFHIEHRSETFNILRATQSLRQFNDDIFTCIFLNENIYFDYEFPEVCYQGSNLQYSTIGSNNGLAPSRREAIIWTNGGLSTHMRHPASKVKKSKHLDQAMLTPMKPCTDFNSLWKAFSELGPETRFLVSLTRYSHHRPSLLWRHNGRDSISNHQPHDCLLNRLFRRRSKKTSKLRVTGLCAGIHRGPVNSPHKWPVTRKIFPFDDVRMMIWIVDMDHQQMSRLPTGNA